MTPVHNENRQLPLVECQAFRLVLLKSKFQRHFIAMHLNKPSPITVKNYNVLTRWNAEFATLGTVYIHVVNISKTKQHGTALAKAFISYNEFKYI